MKNVISKVRTFHEKIGAPISERPELLPFEVGNATQAAKLLRESLTEVQRMGQQSGDLLSRLCLAIEELTEWVEAHVDGNVTAAADAWGDRLYVLLGDAVATGLPGQDIFDEVHRSNMTKSGLHDRTGKGVKSDGFIPPSLSTESTDRSLREYKTVMKIVHCDWGSGEEKRAICIASRQQDGWKVERIENAGDPLTLVHRMRSGMQRHERLVIGFDFVIGYPVAFGRRAQLNSFLDAIPNFGAGPWEDFFIKARLQDEISIHRPFYPRSCRVRGEATREMLTNALEIEWDQLLRECERETPYRRQASPLFWTLGAKQVGTATMRGWQEVIQPIARDVNTEIGLWPFTGTLGEILEREQDVVVETYPGEAYHHLGFPHRWSGKRCQLRRLEMSENFHRWAATADVEFADSVRAQIDDGFGEEADGEDPFDALVGACSMIDVVRGVRAPGTHSSADQGIHEGWIFGQSPI
jgi:predicted HAD superfamily Cof-like phosphohydrolase